MPLSVWIPLLTATVVISLTPGAGGINTMTNSLRVGWRRSLWGILGQQIALVIQIAIVAAGVGAVVAGSPVLFNAIRYVGAAYLVYLGLRMIFTRVRETSAPEKEALERAATGSLPSRAPGWSHETAWSLVRRGIGVNLLNPKAIVFFLAFLPQFIRPSEPLLTQYLVIVLTVVGVDIVVMAGFFAVAARPFRRFAATERGQRVMNSVFGGLFIAVAALLLFAH